jgi:hypothetical protein
VGPAEAVSLRVQGQPGGSCDSKARRRRVPPVLEEEGPEDREAAELGTFKTRAAAEKHERAVQYFKRRG